jgi:hypothetical protein
MQEVAPKSMLQLLLLSVGLLGMQSPAWHTPTSAWKNSQTRGHHSHGKFTARPAAGLQPAAACTASLAVAVAVLGVVTQHLHNALEGKPAGGTRAGTGSTTSALLQCRGSTGE